MIKNQEILDFAREFSLRADIIEKDYVLGWVLAGIANHAELADKLIFKGGTCLKKCYFETYRFSEDLDYTLIDENHVNEKFLVSNFQKIAQWVNEATGIEIPNNAIKFEVYQNSAGKVSVEGRLGYMGPLQRRNSLARIKLDLTTDELLVSDAIFREVHHPYSDKPDEGMKAKCYSFPEIFAEKIRALSERARPRDLYDVIHIYRHANHGEKATLVFEILKKKCEYKGIPVPTIQSLETHPKIHELKSEWVNMLAHQLPLLPPREEFWNELPDLFKWLHGSSSKIIKTPIQLPPHKEIDHSWQPPSMIQAWHMKTPLELVRYAGANHLCVELADKNSKKLIEPYDLRRTKDGNLLIIVIEHISGEWRSYCVDRIQSIEVSNVPFTPRYLISLTPALR